MKRYLALSLILLFISGCASPTNIETADVTPTPKIIQVDNLKSCQMWQESGIEFLEATGGSEGLSVGAYWAQGIKLKNASQYAESELQVSLLAVAEKFLSITEEDFINGWSTTPAQDAARDTVISFCETLGVFVK